MTFNEIDNLLMGEFKGESQGMIYAKGVGKATAILWSLMHTGNEEVAKAVERALLRSAKDVEESAT